MSGLCVSGKGWVWKMRGCYDFPCDRKDGEEIFFECMYVLGIVLEFFEPK